VVLLETALEQELKGVISKLHGVMEKLQGRISAESDSMNTKHRELQEQIAKFTPCIRAEMEQLVSQEQGGWKLESKRLWQALNSHSHEVDELTGPAESELREASPSMIIRNNAAFSPPQVGGLEQHLPTPWNNGYWDNLVSHASSIRSSTPPRPIPVPVSSLGPCTPPRRDVSPRRSSAVGGIVTSLPPHAPPVTAPFQERLLTSSSRTVLLQQPALAVAAVPPPPPAAAAPQSFRSESQETLDPASLLTQEALALTPSTPGRSPRLNHTSGHQHVATARASGVGIVRRHVIQW